MALERSRRIVEEGSYIFTGLTKKNLKGKELQFIFGIRPVAEAISSGREINKVFIRKNLQSELFSNLFQKIREAGIPFQFVPVEKLNGMVKGNHQGIIASLSLIEYKNLEEIVQRTFEEGRHPFILILDQITDVRNFGAITRTAECAGIDVVVIPEKNSVSITPDAIKASAGALNRIAVSRKRDLAETVQFLQKSGILVIAVTEKSDHYYYTADLQGPLALLLGSEETGISNNLLQLSDDNIKIPMAGAIDSLNVSVACGIIAFEVVRQRMQNA
jgi:23S rRNA (guanosine2251-2'-O)-methyltransferase